MNPREELVERCAKRRREQLGNLSDQAFEELLLAVKSDPASFVETPREKALALLARAYDAYRESQKDDDLLDDDQFQQERARRLLMMRRTAAEALELDPGFLEARVLDAMASDLEPDPLLDALVAIEKTLDPVPVSACPEDPWADLDYRGYLRLLAAIARTCLDGARYRMAADTARMLVEACPDDPLGARYTWALALARLEDEAGFDALDARFSRRGNTWLHLARVLLLFKLNRLPAAKRALRGFDELVEGGAYALLRPTYIEVYLPDRPTVAAGSFEEALLAVREADPIIADVPDFPNWCQGFDWFEASAKRFAEAHDLDW